MTTFARDCVAFDRIRRIAEWVGDGKPVTPKGVLRPADLKRASAATGLPIPERFRSAADVPSWNRLWTAALAIDAISLESGVVTASPPVEVTSEVWLTAFAAALAATFADEEGIASLHIGRAALTVLASGKAETVEQLKHEVWLYLSSDYDHDYGRLRSAAGYEESAALLGEVLVEFGAVTRSQELTDVGRWALSELIRRGDDVVTTKPHVASGQICQLKITLVHMRPPCWRRVLVSSTATLSDLHWVIQAAMRWDDDHLHGFNVGRRTYGYPGYEIDDENGITVGEAFTRTRKRIEYIYDYGATWRHDIELERTFEPDPALTYPTCVAGSGSVPVEDTRNRMIKFDQDDINRRLGVDESEDPYDSVIEKILEDAYDDDSHGSFYAVLDEVLKLPADATVLGHPVTVLELGYEDHLRGPFALCRGELGTAEIGLVDVCFPPALTAAWVHAAYRSHLGTEPFPATPRPDWRFRS